MNETYDEGRKDRPAWFCNRNNINSRTKDYHVSYVVSFAISIPATIIIIRSNHFPLARDFVDYLTECGRISGDRQRRRQWRLLRKDYSPTGRDVDRGGGLEVGSRHRAMVNFNVLGESSSSSSSSPASVYLVRPFKIIPQVPLQCALQIATS